MECYILNTGSVGANGDFKGVWYKHNLYDGHSKVILTRTHY